NLKRDGYLETTPDNKDKRTSIVSISQKGKELIEKLFPNHAKNFEEYFKVLDDEETDTLFKILRKLHKSL
ncbi:MAG: MarR family transcriptional regulator, partial [Arcobacteraceae bacterium]|nr:MarR family transcriptional regulator [Arcobacteraceae bacterium]